MSCRRDSPAMYGPRAFGASLLAAALLLQSLVALVSARGSTRWQTLSGELLFRLQLSLARALFDCRIGFGFVCLVSFSGCFVFFEFFLLFCISEKVKKFDKMIIVLFFVS
uniref:Uncharacterized protein n=1 Tax=Rhizophora mucronata TaxID=61149 RepID=A0A2P2K3T8_RHIMU